MFDACDPDLATFCTSFDPAEDNDANISGQSPRLLSFCTTRAELLLDFCVVAAQSTVKLILRFSLRLMKQRCVVLLVPRIFEHMAECPTEPRRIREVACALKLPGVPVLAQANACDAI